MNLKQEEKIKSLFTKSFKTLFKWLVGLFMLVKVLEFGFDFFSPGKDQVAVTNEEKQDSENLTKPLSKDNSGPLEQQIVGENPITIKSNKETQTKLPNIVVVEENNIPKGKVEQQGFHYREGTKGSKYHSNTASIFIFKNQLLDTQIIQHIASTYFNVYDIVVPSNIVTQLELREGNFTAVNTTEFVCIGEVVYHFKEDSSKTTCELVITFNTYATQTGIKLKDLSKSLTTYGIGFSKTQAQRNAIAKIH